MNSDNTWSCMDNNTVTLFTPLINKMTIIYLTIILLQIGVIIFFVRRGKMPVKQRGEREAIPKEDTFEGLRRLALDVTPYQLKLAIPDSETLVYGVVMDWNMGDTVVTLASYITGAANL